MAKHPRVKDLLIFYSTQGMTGVARYLSDEDLIIDPSTWTGKMKRLLDSHNWSSMEAEIASMLFTFKLGEKDGRESNRYDEFSDHGPEDRGDDTE
jgi:hypothetical protein